MAEEEVAESMETDRSDDVKKDQRAKPKVKAPSGPLFSLKKWNAVAMWQWDVECDTCAICRVQVMGKPMAKFLINAHHKAPRAPKLSSDWSE